MTDGTFERVQRSDKCMYGPQKLLLCGFSEPAQAPFASLLKTAGLPDVPVVWVDEESQHRTLSELLNQPAGSGAGRGSEMPRAIVVSGITENQLHALMTLTRESGMQPALWAALTPTSETWTLKQLLAELQAEREAFSRQRRQP